MAKPKADLAPAHAIRALADGEGRLALRVTPGARTEAVTIAGGVVHIKVRARPDGGAANAAVLELLARTLNTAPSRITLLRGATSRQKLVQLG
ncbi:DUF167 domain-containing protein [Alteraurantiacibacter palmitatis]|uniref:DUF167 domain-containing protein n=1 Tax=Alteraurantiacibacter palmitatis TaxID=2054628 RepID=A0ABV7E573_9SPHN